MKLAWAMGTDTGRVRDLNEDAVFAYVRPHGAPRGLFIVCDGMGGHEAGDVASKLAIETMWASLRWFLERDDAADTQIFDTQLQHNTHKTRLKIGVEKANEAIRQHGLANPNDLNLGTTLTCALVVGEMAYIGNVGDSRTYALHDGEIVQVTEDHSYVGHLIRLGELEEAEIYTHPKRSLITRALGNEERVAVDVWERPFSPTSTLLLCSDGLWEMVHGKETYRDVLANSDNLDIAVQTLIDQANEAGGEDNIGIVAVRMDA